MRHLAAMKIVSVAEGRFHATPLTDGLAQENFQKTIQFCYDITRPAFNCFPEYFKANEYKDSVTALNGPFQHAFCPKEPMHFFPWLQANPPNLDLFAAFMSAYRAGHKNWWDVGVYPVHERLVEGFDASASDVLLVDMGGGRGHDLDQLLTVHQQRPGRVILQDLEPVIETIEDKEAKQYEAQVHDFFTPQTIKAARAYSLHSILHDWDDEDSLRILENLVPALKPG